MPLEQRVHVDHAARELGVGDRGRLELACRSRHAQRRHQLERQVEHPIGPPFGAVRLAGVHLARGDDDDVAGALRHGASAVADPARPGFDRAEGEGLVEMWREAVPRVGSTEYLERRVPLHQRDSRRFLFA